MYCYYLLVLLEAKLRPSFFSQQIIRPLANPIKQTGHIQILYGNIAPEGSVAKITGKEGLYFSGELCCNHNIPFDEIYTFSSEHIYHAKEKIVMHLSIRSGSCL